MVIARELVLALRDEGHQADVVITPQNRFGRQAAAYLATWLTDVGSSGAGPIDLVISLRYPSYAVRHPKHVCWLNHTMREYYDQWERFSSRLSPQGRLKERLRRRLIQMADRYLLTKNVSRLFVLSGTVQDRLRIWPELKSTVLYPPAPRRAYRCDEYGEYIFMVSRLTALKRADLLIQALATSGGSGIRAVIGGEGEERERLQRLAERLGVADRVTLAGRLTDDELVDHFARCRAVCFVPLDEDYGFVTAEAFASQKPVITCRDSGGPAELVEDGVSGFICEPTPTSVASALRRVMDDPTLAERLGRAGRAVSEDLNWPETVKKLTEISL
jgi:glycosyltransferase involved in cell wall biosynthesis